MLTIIVPGFRSLQLRHLVLDYNGTIALDGELLPGISERLARLDAHLDIHLVTADTHGSAARQTAKLPCRLEIIGPEYQDLAKERFIDKLDPELVAAVGNGRNDLLMLQRAALGIAVIQAEGGSGMVAGSADVLCTSILDAFDLLLYPARLIATLRN